MSFAPTELDFATGSVGSSIDSNAVNFTSGRLYIVAVAGNGSTSRTCTGVSGAGATWTEVNGGTDSTWSDGTNWACTLFWATDASGSAQTITATYSGSWSASRRIHIFEIADGFDTSGLIVNDDLGATTGAGGSGGTTAAVADSAAAANMRFCYFVHRVDETMTAGNGGALVGLQHSGSPSSCSQAAWYKTGDATSDPSVTYSSTTRGAGWVYVEIKAAAAGVTATPSALSSVTAFPSPTPTTSALSTPSTLASTSAFPSPTITIGITATPTTLASTTAFATPAPTTSALTTSTTLASTTSFPSPTIITQISPWAVNSTWLELNGVKTHIKAVNQYVGVTGSDWGDSSITTIFSSTNLANFVADLVAGGFNLVRLPLINDTSTTYKDYLKTIISALAASDIYTLLDPHDTSTFGAWPTVSTTNDTATAAAQYCIDLIAYLDAADRPFILCETFNEPNSITWANWFSGTTAAIDTLRSGGYDGPIFCDSNDWSWTYPVTTSYAATDLVAYDPNVVVVSHRYATNDGSNYLGDHDPDTTPDTGGGFTQTWKEEWPDQAGTDGVCIIVGEWGPANGGPGTGRTVQQNVDGWCTVMGATIVAANTADHCAGFIAWIWDWSDGNELNDYTDWQSGTITRTNWGTLVYGLFNEVAATPSTLTSTTAFPSPTVTTSPTVTPSALAEVTSFPSLSVTVSETITPSALTSTTSFPSPVLVSSGLVTPTALASTTAFPSSTPLASGLVLASVLAITTSFPTPTASAAGTPSPSALSSPTTFPSPSLVTSALSLPSSLASVTAFPSPTPSATVSPVPSSLSEVTGFPAPTVTGAGLVSPGALATVDGLGLPTPLGSGVIAPTALASATAFPSPSPSTSALVSGSILASVTAFPSPTTTGFITLVLPTPTRFTIASPTSYGFRLTTVYRYRFIISSPTSYTFRISNE